MRFAMRSVLLIFALASSACGAAPPPAEEVSAAWTSGDDAPLDAPADPEPE